MKISYLIAVSVIAVAVSAGSSRADTQYHFSGSACHPWDTANYAKLEITGVGPTNKSITSYDNAYVACPVTGIISTTLTQTQLKVHVYNGVQGYWEVDNQTFGFIWFSSNKSNVSGSGNLTWSTTDLYGSSFSNYAGYTFRGIIGSRCNATCATDQSYLQAYWVTHTQS